MTVVVNGKALEVGPSTTLAELVIDLGRDPAGRGLAIAVNGEVVPRTAWAHRSLTDSDRVEVLGATPGG